MGIGNWQNANSVIGANSRSFFFLQNSGVVYDCVTWNPLYRYDTAEVDKKYRILQDTRGPGEADDQRKVSHTIVYKHFSMVA